MTPNNRSKVDPGTIVGGKFKITREIGRGGMAAVYEATNQDIGKRVAVKILAAELVKSKVVTGRFLREARAMAAIRSPYICEVFDSGEFDDRPFMILELLEGESLYDLLTRVRRLDTDLTLKIAAQCAQGLSAAHGKSVIHRDLKPENIFITKGEGGIVAKLLDFGLAKFYDSTGDVENVRLTREGALFGTPAYMSPEQAKGVDQVDHRTDLWALGCIVYECLTGKTVWNADQGVAMILAQIAGAPVPRPSRLRPDLPRTFDDWFQRALDRDPNRRFQTCEEWIASLERALKPPAGTEKQVPLHSTEEAEIVDELVFDSGDAGARQPERTPTPPATSSPADEESAVASSPKPITSMPPPRVKSRAGTAIVVLLTITAAAIVGYAVWLYVVHPPSVPRLATVRIELPSDEAGAAETLEPIEKDPVAIQLDAAQVKLATGKADEALNAFKDAFNNGGHRVARSLLSHVAVGVSGGGKCTLTGIGHPRPFEVKVPIGSRPSIALTPRGLAVSWVDTHEDAQKRIAFAVLLDGSLRRVTPVRNVTPEADAVRHPQLSATKDSLALLYGQSGDAPGVFLRRLGAEARIAGPGRQVSAGKRGQFFASAAPLPDGTHWVVWQEEIVPGVEDVVARRVDADFAPMGEPVRLTGYAPVPGAATEAGRPHAAVAHGKLYVTYGFERLRDYQITVLRVALDDAALATGLAAPGATAAKVDAFVGKVQRIGPTTGKGAQPRLACTADGCFVTWDDETGGAFAAFLDGKTGEAIWHREIAKRGSRPAVAVSPAGEVAVAFFDASRLRIGRLTRDGLEAPSVLARVSGYQPYPEIVAAPAPGQWYVAWRDYESGRLEAFVARAQCQ